MAVTIAEYVDGLLGPEHVRRRRLVGRGAHVQERRHQRPVDPADRRAAQPAAWRHAAGSAGPGRLELVHRQRHDQLRRPGQRRADRGCAEQRRHGVELQPGPGDRRRRWSCGGRPATPRCSTTARRLADAAIGSGALVTDGVLTESCDAPGRHLRRQRKQFKGIFHAVPGWISPTPPHDARYQPSSTQQAETIWDERPRRGRAAGPALVGRRAPITRTSSTGARRPAR